MLTAPSRLRHQLYLLVRPARSTPDYRAGLRAALSTAVPLLAATALHLSTASWLSIAGFNVALADKGGSYRTRAMATGALALTGALAAMLGGLAANHALLAVLLVAVWSTLATLARVLGSSAMSVGISSTIMLVISLALPARGLRDAGARALAVLAGSAWAMLLSLGFWPLRPFRPLRLAVLRVYRELAQHADMVAGVARVRGAEADVMVFDDERRRLRAQIEEARALLVSSRRGGPAGSERGERLLVLVELADQLFGLAVAAADLLESSAATRAADVSLQHPRVAQALSQVAANSRAVMELVLLERAPDEPTRKRLALVTASSRNGAIDPEVSHDADALLAARLVSTSHAAVDTSAHLETVEGPGAHADVIAPHAAPPGPSAIALIRASVGRDSLALHHALRVGIMMAIAVAVPRLLPLGRGYWLTITVLLVLQPESGTTVIRAAQRVVGTLIGAGITAAVALLLPGPKPVIALIIVLIFACVSLLPVNYLLFTAVLTPAFVLLAELSAGDWHLAALRVENTLIGGAIALLGVRLLWPRGERSRFSELMDAALRACIDHLREAARQWNSHEAAAGRALAQARRRAALAASNAETAFESMLVTTAEPASMFEARMTMLTYTRRLLVSDVALSTMRRLEGVADAQPLVERLASIAERALSPSSTEQESEQIERQLAALIVDASAFAEIARQLERIARQLLMLRRAVLRLGQPV